MVSPSEHLINSIEEIAAIQDSLSLGERSLTSARGLHVKTKGLATGELQYMAGGRLITKLVFIKEPDGTKSVKKYQPGDWEFKVEETLELCRTLKRAAEDLKGWPPEKIQVYDSEKPINADMLNSVAEANREHYEENHKQWRLGGLPRWLELRDMFLDELKKEWPIEYVELQTNPRGEKYIAEVVRENITKAYVTGYMYGRGWITPEELTNATLYLGEVVAEKVRHGIKDAKSKGIAFADVLAHIAVIGNVNTGITEREDTGITEEKADTVMAEEEKEANAENVEAEDKLEEPK